MKRRSAPLCGPYGLRRSVRFLWWCVTESAEADGGRAKPAEPTSQPVLVTEESSPGTATAAVAVKQTGISQHKSAQDSDDVPAVRATVSRTKLDEEPATKLATVSRTKLDEEPTIKLATVSRTKLDEEPAIKLSPEHGRLLMLM